MQTDCRSRLDEIAPLSRARAFAWHLANRQVDEIFANAGHCKADPVCLFELISEEARFIIAAIKNVNGHSRIARCNSASILT